MILTKKVSIKLNKSLIEKYNYIGDSGDIIEINVSDLPLNSTKKIDVCCDICGVKNNIEYRMYMKNYNKYNLYTCLKCSSIKKKKTFIKNYGVDNPMKSDIIKNKLKKTINSKYNSNSYLGSDDFKNKNNLNLERLGVKNYQQIDDVREKTKKTKKEKYGENLKIIIDKTRSTKKEKYGDENYNNINKVKKTNIEKYGVEYPLQNKDIYDKSIITIFKKYGDYIVKLDDFRKIQLYKKTNTDFNNIKNKFTNLTFIDKKNGHYHIMCDIGNNHTFEINFNLFHLRNMYGNVLCTICNNPNDRKKSSFQIQVENFLQTNNIEYIINDRKILNGKEIDIYIPEHKIAIECNGLYWHSEIFKDKKYHYNKFIECKKNNIKLINIWEDDWLHKRNIVESILLNNFNKIKEKIYSRKCDIKVINDTKLVKNFLNNNHIQGFSPSSIKVGLFYENELVSLMTFSHRYINKKRTLELVRFCNKINTIIHGSFSKLISFFNNNFNKQNEKIITYADLSMFNGNVYSKYNFEKSNNITPNYYWVVNGVRKHRFNYNKKKLIKQGFDENMTEYDIMHSLGYYKIWGVGIQKWETK